jgi:hypothetical protein
MAKEIQLTQGKVAIVDDEDYIKCLRCKWCCNLIHGKYYAITVIKTNGKWKEISMHRYIMKPKNNLQVDHINSNGLDNRKENLRLCTQSENKRNRIKNKNNTSGYKGVIWNKLANKWQSQIKYKNKLIYIGIYSDIHKAAEAYNTAAIKYHGKFANLNKIL